MIQRDYPCAALLVPFDPRDKAENRKRNPSFGGLVALPGFVREASPENGVWSRLIAGKMAGL
jgi:hypothetical protein